MTPASLEHGRLAGEGQAKFTDKGQFEGSGGWRGRQAREKDIERAQAKEGEKLDTRERDLSPCFKMMKYPKTSATDPA